MKKITEPKISYIIFWDFFYHLDRHILLQVKKFPKYYEAYFGLCNFLYNGCLFFQNFLSCSFIGTPCMIYFLFTLRAKFSTGTFWHIVKLRAYMDYNVTGHLFKNFIFIDLLCLLCKINLRIFFDIKLLIFIDIQVVYHI